MDHFWCVYVFVWCTCSTTDIISDNSYQTFRTETESLLSQSLSRWGTQSNEKEHNCYFGNQHYRNGVYRRVLMQKRKIARNQQHGYVQIL